jgi:hypothetical protein
VLGMEELGLHQTLPQHAGSHVLALVPVDGEVWACVGKDVVVWGMKR